MEAFDSERPLRKPKELVCRLEAVSDDVTRNTLMGIFIMLVWKKWVVNSPGARDITPYDRNQIGRAIDEQLTVLEGLVNAEIHNIADNKH